jgi:hypothetical protein
VQPLLGQRKGPVPEATPGPGQFERNTTKGYPAPSPWEAGKIARDFTTALERGRRQREKSKPPGLVPEAQLCRNLRSDFGVLALIITNDLITNDLTSGSAPNARSYYGLPRGAETGLQPSTVMAIAAAE